MYLGDNDLLQKDAGLRLTATVVTLPRICIHSRQVRVPQA